MGIPHSTQIRTRCRGSVFRENSFFRNDMFPETSKPVRRFAEIRKTPAKAYNFVGTTRHKAALPRRRLFCR
jgi:hypothetical protein